ncbi:Hypothetical protein R9X50_00098000 [Acrodontium crateriforme]|uniref:FAD-binding domain-containing protein n=1 Tax=Acrodontium crateriforme TaxID=150365 RepID=A0AAQ3LYJ1_9PEZI|nr:Hypothetical protein R9X50_00098000 [Acrodontium crateriforme]
MESTPPIAGKRIVISGAGIAGLSFARALDRFWPAEHEKPTVAMRTLGLLEELLQQSTTSASDVSELPCAWDKDWTLIGKFNAPKPLEGLPVNRVRIFRRTLRNILLQALPEIATVNWKKGCNSAQNLSSGKVAVTLDDGSKDECDLLIVADGANSMLRSHLVPEDNLDYAGVVCMMGTSRFPYGKPAPLTKDWGICFSGQGIPFLTFPVDDNNGVWALTYRSETPIKPIRGLEAIKCKDEILDQVRCRGHMFAEPFDQSISASDPETLQVFNAMQKNPDPTLFIGDANHAMTPFSGNGANMALMDGVELGRQLSSPATVRQAVVNFDAESSPRSQAAIDQAWWIIRILHSRGFFIG